jgi:NAD(P)H-quinone oxidoreductase subunit L
MGAGGLEPPQSCDLRILSPLRLPISPCPHSEILDSTHLAIVPVALSGSLSSLPLDTLLVIGAYLVLAGAYLLVVPLALYWWMHKRWYVMGKIERTAIYGMVFLFFPGLILFAPFLNLRMAGQGEA